MSSKMPPEGGPAEPPSEPVDTAGSETPAASNLRERLRKRRERLAAALPLGPRIVIFVIGWTLVLVGVVGLVLPGIQGVLTIVAGAALLSLVSELFYSLLRRTLRERWPKVWRKIEAFRLKLFRRLSRRKRR